MAGAGLKATRVMQDFTGFHAQQLQHAQQQQQLQKQQHQCLIVMLHPSMTGLIGSMAGLI